MNLTPLISQGPCFLNELPANALPVCSLGHTDVSKVCRRLAFPCAAQTFSSLSAALPADLCCYQWASTCPQYKPHFEMLN